MQRGHAERFEAFELAVRELYVRDLIHADAGDVRMGTFILCADRSEGAAGAGAQRLVMAGLLAPAGGNDVGLRFPGLDHLLIVGRCHLERVLRVYVPHYNEHRPHRALGLVPPDRSRPVARAELPVRVTRRDLLGGVIHEYRTAA